MAWTREQMAQRRGREMKDGYYVNLGIGIPTLVANYIPDGIGVMLQSKTACSAWARSRTRPKWTPDMINAGKQTVTADSGASIFASATSFAMIRGGHIELAMLGAMQVRASGDIAYWIIPGKLVKGMGGAMDLVAGTPRVIVLTEHNPRTARPRSSLSARCP